MLDEKKFSLLLSHINQVKSSWSKDIIIRFLYTKLAPYFQRDLFYFLADEKDKEQQFRQGFINRFPHIVCSTLADFYVDLFKQFGINAKKIIANSAKIPLFAMIVEGEHGWFYLDALNDLFYNQYGLKPYNFGIIPTYKTVQSHYPEIIKLPKEYVAELDEELNLTYLDDYFSIFHHILSQKKEAYEFFGLKKESKEDLKERKINLYNENFINLGNVSGPFERAQLYKFLNDQILNRGEKRFTKVRLEGGCQHPHISLELINLNGSTFFEEIKQNEVYTLKKILR